MPARAPASSIRPGSASAAAWASAGRDRSDDAPFGKCLRRRIDRSRLALREPAGRWSATRRAASSVACRRACAARPRQPSLVEPCAPCGERGTSSANLRLSSRRRKSARRWCVAGNHALRVERERQNASASFQLQQHRLRARAACRTRSRPNSPFIRQQQSSQQHALNLARLRSSISAVRSSRSPCRCPRNFSATKRSGFRRRSLSDITANRRAAPNPSDASPTQQPRLHKSIPDAAEFGVSDSVNRRSATRIHKVAGKPQAVQPDQRISPRRQTTRADLSSIGRKWPVG